MFKNEVFERYVLPTLIVIVSFMFIYFLYFLTNQLTNQGVKNYIIEKTEIKSKPNEMDLFFKEAEEFSNQNKENKINQVNSFLMLDRETKIKEIAKLQDVRNEDNDDEKIDNKVCEYGWTGCITDYNPFLNFEDIKDKNDSDALYKLKHKTLVENVDVNQEKVIVSLADIDKDNTLSKEAINVYTMNLLSDLRFHNVDIDELNIRTSNLELKLTKEDMDNINLKELNYLFAEEDEVFKYTELAYN